MRIESDGEPPEGLIAAFERYERALAADDLTELDELFEPGEGTVRSDPAGVVVGHDAIAAFRRGRGGAPARAVVVLHVRVLSPDAAMLVAGLAPAAGGLGQQTQLWRRTAGAWRIAVAHVSATPPAIDQRVWRVIGTPLVPPRREGWQLLEDDLTGERVAVKDLFAIEGQRIGAGVPAYLAEAPLEASTAPAVQALLDAGAEVVGIARTDELAYSIAGANPHYGTPPNPAVPGALPGGSSSGPAAAVALGQATIGLATDTAGSIRVPASYQGLWGLRPTHGAVPVEGLLPLAPSFDTVGWLTRDADVLRRAAAVSLRAARPAPAAQPLAVAPALLAELNDAVRAAFESVLDGVDVDEVDLGDVDAAYEAFRTAQAFEAWRTNGPWIERHPGTLRGGVADRFAWASTITPAAAEAAGQHLAGQRSALLALLAERTLVLPAAASTAPRSDAGDAGVERARAQTLRLTCFASLAGAPAVSAPLASVAGAPLGVSLVGSPGSDMALIGLAAGLQRS